jgi:hypothetical protein
MSLVSLEDTSGLINTINSMIVLYASYKEELDYNKHELLDGEDIYNFYRKMLLKFNDMKRNLQ